MLLNYNLSYSILEIKLQDFSLNWITYPLTTLHILTFYRKSHFVHVMTRFQIASLCVWIISYTFWCDLKIQIALKCVRNDHTRIYAISREFHTHNNAISKSYFYWGNFIHIITRFKILFLSREFHTHNNAISKSYF